MTELRRRASAALLIVLTAFASVEAASMSSSPATDIASMSSDDVTDSRDESPEQAGGDRSLARPAVDVSETGLNSGDNDPSTFDPGDIISDAVFYDSQAMSDEQIRSFLNEVGAGCTGPSCLHEQRWAAPPVPADEYCGEVIGGPSQDAADIIGEVSRACGVNPQVMLTTLQKESGLLDRTDVTAAQYQAAWGWDCPDTGPGGTANCDPAHAGFVNQAYGMAAQWARYRTNPERYTYRAGETAEVLWNVRESGCGSAPVTFANTATASLYNYTPYQPNAAALAAYPGTGDECSSYGNRNFYFMFRKYFGSTGGGRIGSAPVAGTEVVVPTGPYVAPTIGGRTITAPTPAVAAGLSAGFAALGMPYVWGGGGSGSGPSDGCARGGGEFNSCGTQIGFDCSGLTAFVLAQAGYSIPGNSTEQRAAGARIPWSDAEPGDIVGFPGHVAVYLGVVDGVPHLLEASWVGTPISVTTLTRSDVDPVVYRFWSGPPGSTPRDRSGIGGPRITPDPSPGADPAPRVLVPGPAPSRPPAGTGPIPTAPAAEQPGPTPADPRPVMPAPTQPPEPVPSVPVPIQPTPPAQVAPPPAPTDPTTPELPTPPAEPGGTDPVSDPNPNPNPDPPAAGDRWWICPVGPPAPEAIVVDISGNSPAPVMLVRSAVAPGETFAYQGCAADPVLDDMLATVLIEHGMDTMPVADVIVVSRTDAVRLGAPTSTVNP